MVTYEGAKNLMIESDFKNRKKKVILANKLETHMVLLLLIAERYYVK